MKKIILSALCVLFATGTFAQSKFRMGVAYNISASTILSMNNNMSGMGSGSGSMMSNTQMNADIGWKLNPGASLRGEYFFNDTWGMYH